MKKNFLRTLLCSSLLLGAMLTSSIATAQTTQGLFTFEDVTPGGRTFREHFYPQFIERLQWIGDKCVYTKGENLLQKNPNKKDNVLLSLSDVQRLIPSDEVFTRYSMFPGFAPITGMEDCIGLMSQEGYYIVNVKKQQLVRFFRLTSSTRDDFYSLVDIDPTYTRAVVRSSKGEMLVTKALTQPQEQATFDLVAQNKEDRIVYGEAVHQREFGIESGTFWSPDGSKLAFYRMDQSMVSPYPLVNMGPKKAEVVPIRYPMAGDPSHHVTVGIYDLSSKQTTYLATGGDPEHFLTNIAWNPDTQRIYIAEINRAQTRSDVNEYDVTTGKRIRTLFTEEDAKYIEPQNPMVFFPNNRNKFLWLSRKDGYNHLYLGDLVTGKMEQITRGAWEVTQFKAFSRDARTLFFDATKATPTESRLYSIRIDGTNLTELTPDAGVHHTQLNSSATAFIDTYSSLTIPRNIEMRSTTGKKIATLLSAPNPAAAYRLPSIELGTLMSRDGTTDLHYRLIKPLDFDPKKQYPVIVYVYGGPHAQLVTNSWMGGASGWDVYMAQRGYVVFTLDNRGSANRGRDFEQAIHRRVGTIEMEDQMCGIDYLFKQPWIDRSRVGVYGWSFGGFMTTNLMLTHSDIFKVGVAGGPVMDWSRYEVMYGERYNDTPEENPEGYKANNLTLRAKDLKGRLLLIHGTVDNVVVWQHGQAFVKAAIDARTYPDCMFYPGHEHNVIGVDRVHLNTTIARYFEDHL